MNTVLWAPPRAPHHRHEPPPTTAPRGGLFPPVVVDTEPFPRRLRDLSRPAELAMLANALTEPRFAPVTAALRRLSDWNRRAATRHRVVVPGELSLDNTALFGPLVTELFTVCAAGGLSDPAAHCRRRTAGWLRHLDGFLAHHEADRPELERRFGPLGPVLGLSAHGDETHDGGRRVLRLRHRDGPALAYKVRPVDGEALFTAATEADEPRSVFALLNELTDSPELELPTLRCLRRGEGRAARLWQEWVEPAPRRPIHRDGPVTVTGPVVPPERAPRLWSRAGALAAAATAFGIGDLIEGNLLLGTRYGRTEPRHQPVDLEVFGLPVVHLYQTGLVAGAGPFHHVGFENRPRGCGSTTPTAYFRETDSGLELVRTSRSWARETTDTVVSDGVGNFGYGVYLPHFARGAFDLWATLCRHRETVAEFARQRLGTGAARVVPRDTGDYARILADHLLTGAPLPRWLHETEREQLAAGDVPYYLARPGTDRLTTPGGAAGPAVDPLPGWPTSQEWTLANLGPLLRGAVAHADLRESATAAGVRVGACEVAVAVPEFGSRLVYTWDEDTDRVAIADLAEPEPLTEVADRLRRIDDADAVLRTEWIEGDRTDTALAERLGELVAEALVWLEAVVDEHGWPTAELVGVEAADGAVRLLQHAEGSLEFRRRCLRELTAAARHGRAKLPDVAFVTDSLRLAEGLPQRYGTKFQRVDGELVPFALADPDRVDADRAAMGLSSLSDYARLVRRRFDAQIPQPEPGAAR